MRDPQRSSSRLTNAFVGTLAGAALLVAGGGTASAATRIFSAQSLIIPMDQCYQPTAGNGGTPTGGFATCPDPAGTADDGVIKAYGLVYQLLAAGVKVYYIEDPTKSAITGIDMTITAGSGTPVSMQSHSTAAGSQTEFMTATHTTINYAGAPFVIDATDYTTAQTLIHNDYVAATPQFKNVNIHYAKQNFSANVYQVLSQVPPRIALLDIGGAAVVVLTAYLQDAGLYNGGALASYPSIGAIFTQFDNVTDFTTSNGLVAGGFQILWAPHWEADTMVSTDRDAVMQKISSFVDAGNIFFAQCAAVGSVEGATPVTTSYGSFTVGAYSNFMTTAVAPTRGLSTNKLPNSVWPGATAGEGIAINPAYMTSPLVQIGNFNYVATGSASTFDFIPAAPIVWKAGVEQLITTTAPSTETAYQNKVIMTAMHKDNDPNKGLIVYLGGHAYGSKSNSCNPTCGATTSQTQDLAGERLVLNSLMFLGQPPSSLELSQSAPIIDDVTGDVYQGSYIEESLPAAQYPPWDGHFREYPPNAVTAATTAFDKLVSDWDAANLIPSSTTRKVITATQSGTTWTQRAFTVANASVLAAPMGLTAPAASTAISGILAGGLGGIDHSVPALVKASQLAGSTARPTVAYVGGLDGMLHAIAISGGSPAVTPGQELWAYIPPSMLTKISATGGYSAGVDGSPAVQDAFVDTGGGTMQWRTLLASTNAAFGGTISLIDVTDPINPVFMWEAAQGTGTYQMGAAKASVIATVLSNTGPRSEIIVAAQNLGAAGNGFNLYALSPKDGSILWQLNKTFARHIPPASTVLVPSDIPGQPSVLDDTGLGSFANRIIFGDEDGKVWKIDPLSGTTTTPPTATKVYDPNVDGEPLESGLAIYRESSLNDLSVLAVGGAADWVPTTTLSTVFAVSIDTSNSGHIWSTLNLASGERSYATPTVSGNDAYVLTSFGKFGGDIGSSYKDAGKLEKLALGTFSAGAPSYTTVATLSKGASQVGIAADGSVVTTSAGGLTSTQNTLSVGQKINNKPKPFVVAAWLDFR